MNAAGKCTLFFLGQCGCSSQVSYCFRHYGQSSQHNFVAARLIPAVCHVPLSLELTFLHSAHAAKATAPTAVGRLERHHQRHGERDSGWQHDRGRGRAGGGG